MTASGNDLRESLSTDMKHKVAALAQSAARNAVPAQLDADAAAQALAAPTAEDESAASCASYAPPFNVRGRMWQVDSDGPSTSIIDLTSTGNGEVADSSEDE